MPTFDAVCIAEADVQVILVPLDPAFGTKPLPEQRRVSAGLQVRATAGGLTGTVVPVWPTSDGRLEFLAPPLIQDFLRRLDLPAVVRRVNAKLMWG